MGVCVIGVKNGRRNLVPSILAAPHLHHWRGSHHLGQEVGDGRGEGGEGGGVVDDDVRAGALQGHGELGLNPLGALGGGQLGVPLDEPLELRQRRVVLATSRVIHRISKCARPCQLGAERACLRDIDARLQSYRLLKPRSALAPRFAPRHTLTCSSSSKATTMMVENIPWSCDGGGEGGGSMCVG